ncbi:MAG: mandelate racemase/muconate lactonizing enzyme family protein [SAR202 cluster bacterium]|nr:mandelate racemase/muconate lactonizing enzyme family protein [SAR202 cluster bacterium]
MRFERVDFVAIEATQRTTWVFAVFTDAEGVATPVEITLGESSQRVAKSVSNAVARLGVLEIDSESEIESTLGLDRSVLRADRVMATAVSALRTAVVQIGAQRDQQSLTEALSGVGASSVELYANINRSLFATDRTPPAFGEVAERAARAGFRAFKCAPFDEVLLDAPSGPILETAGPGLDRVAAVRQAIGPDARLQVDCHNRFAPDDAIVIAEKLAELDVVWFEEPIRPARTPENLAWIAERVPMPLIAGENEYGADSFSELVSLGKVDVVMPDVKHCGGVTEAVRAGREAVSSGAGFSPHCPSGPISLLASGHVTAAVESAMPLEHAVYEVDWRSELLDPPERVQGGRLWLPEGPGLGAGLNEKVVTQRGQKVDV